MNVKDAVVLVTGANRGLGLNLAKAFLAAGAKKVYAAARNPASITEPGLVPLQLDVTDAASIAAAVQAAPDVSIVVNNAGITLSGTTLASDFADKLRQEVEVNAIAPMHVAQAFAPTLKAHGGGAIVNILSVLSFFSLPGSGTYSASKSAAWNLTNALRGELRAQNTQVLAAHMGFMDTDMTKGIDAPKAAPADIARTIVAALQAGQEEVLTDDTSRQLKAGLTADRPAYLG